MTVPTDDEIERLLREHGPRRPPAFAMLTPCTDLIRALRAKRASCETIRQILQARGVSVAETTLREFCRQVLGELTHHSPPARRKPRAVATSAQTEVPPSNGPSTPPLEPSTSPRPRGPRIANLRRATDS